MRSSSSTPNASMSFVVGTPTVRVLIGCSRTRPSLASTSASTVNGIGSPLRSLPFCSTRPSCRRTSRSLSGEPSCEDVVDERRHASGIHRDLRPLDVDIEGLLIVEDGRSRRRLTSRPRSEVTSSTTLGVARNFTLCISKPTASGCCRSALAVGFVAGACSCDGAGVTDAGRLQEEMLEGCRGPR